MAFDQATAGHAGLAAESTARFGSIDQASPLDCALAAAWAQDLAGTIVDVGRGPGPWTDFLDRQG